MTACPSPGVRGQPPAAGPRTLHPLWVHWFAVDGPGLCRPDPAGRRGPAHMRQPAGSGSAPPTVVGTIARLVDPAIETLAVQVTALRGRRPGASAPSGHHRDPDRPRRIAAITPPPTSTTAPRIHGQIGVPLWWSCSAAEVIVAGVGGSVPTPRPARSATVRTRGQGGVALNRDFAVNSKIRGPDHLPRLLVGH